MDSIGKLFKPCGAGISLSLDLLLTAYVALLRAINVGGTGKLAMKDLVALCVDAGFKNVRTYIQSGNVLFESKLPERNAQARLETAVLGHMGKKVDIILRTTEEMKAILEANPFPAFEAKQVAVWFLHDVVPKDLLGSVVAPAGEKVSLGRREFYVYYPIGQGLSKLKFPALKEPATVRNINTVRKLVEMAV